MGACPLSLRKEEGVFALCLPDRNHEQGILSLSNLETPTWVESTGEGQGEASLLLAR